MFIKLRVRNLEGKIIGYEELRNGTWFMSGNDQDFVNGTFLQPATRELYIGKRDSEDKEIYEFDKIQFEDGEVGVNGDADTFINEGIVGYDEENACFTVSNRVSVDLEDLWCQDIKIL